MGYDLHITRRENWADPHGAHISHEEWLALVEADPELTLDRRNGSNFANWSAPDASEHQWFDWCEGNIYTKNPNQAALGKMLRIAERLAATVQGDDGETYESISDYPESLPIEQRAVRDESSMPAYERREIRWSYIVYGLVALVIIAVNVLDLW